MPQTDPSLGTEPITAKIITFQGMGLGPLKIIRGYGGEGIPLPFKPVAVLSVIGDQGTVGTYDTETNTVSCSDSVYQAVCICDVNSTSVEIEYTPQNASQDANQEDPGEVTH